MCTCLIPEKQALKEITHRERCQNKYCIKRRNYPHATVNAENNDTETFAT